MGFVRIWQGSGEAFDMVDLFLPDVQITTQVRGQFSPALTRPDGGCLAIMAASACRAAAPVAGACAVLTLA